MLLLSSRLQSSLATFLNRQLDNISNDELQSLLGDLLAAIKAEQKVVMTALVAILIPHPLIPNLLDVPDAWIARSASLLSLFGIVMGLVSSTIWLSFVHAVRGSNPSSAFIHDFQSSRSTRRLLTIPALWTTWSLVFLILRLNFVFHIFPLQSAVPPASWLRAANIAMTAVVFTGVACQVLLLTTITRYTNNSTRVPTRQTK